MVIDKIVHPQRFVVPGYTPGWDSSTLAAQQCALVAPLTGP